MTVQHYPSQARRVGRAAEASSAHSRVNPSRRCKSFKHRRVDTERKAGLTRFILLRFSLLREVVSARATTAPALTARRVPIGGTAKHASCPLGRRARPDREASGPFTRGRMTVKTGGAPRARPDASRWLYKDAAVAHELGLRRKLARHRGALFMGPAALPRWPLALLLLAGPGRGGVRASRPITRPMSSRAGPARALHFSPFLVRAAAPAARTPWPARSAPGATASTAAIEEAGQSRPFLVLARST
jgi:hypothetical protein